MQESALGQEGDGVEIARCLLAQLPDALWSQVIALPGLASVSPLSKRERFFCAVGKRPVRKPLPLLGLSKEIPFHFFPIMCEVRVTV